MGFYTVLLVIHTIIVLFLILMVLIQRTDSDGMGGLGGGGGNQFLSGRSTANIMTRTTAILAAAFMISSLTLAVMAGRMSQRSILDTPVTSEKPINGDQTNSAGNDKAAPVNSEHINTKDNSFTDPSKVTEPATPAVPKPE